MTIEEKEQEGELEMIDREVFNEAWALMKAKEDAPNYRKCTSKKCCGNCKAWDVTKTDNPMTGYCEWYDFTCRADHTCDAWAGKK